MKRRKIMLYLISGNQYARVDACLVFSIIRYVMVDYELLEDKQSSAWEMCALDIFRVQIMQPSSYTCRSTSTWNSLVKTLQKLDQTVILMSNSFESLICKAFSEAARSFWYFDEGYQELGSN